MAKTGDGKLFSEAYGPVPVDLPFGQTSRAGEDDAVSMAGPLTSDPVTLHMDCAGEVGGNQGTPQEDPGI